MIRGYTKKNEHNIIYEWKIEKIDNYLTGDFSPITIKSTEFSSGSRFKDLWQLKSVFNNNVNVEIILCLLTNNLKLIETKYSLFILDDEKKKFLKKSYHSQLNTGEGTYLSFSTNCLENNKDKFLPDNILTVCLDLTVFDDPITTSSELELKIQKRLMAQEYKEFYLTKIATDVTINVGDKKFRAHKTILMARSCVFAAMFIHEMIEKKINIITIPDVDPEIFERMLEFIYTDQVSDLDENAELLLEVANKYQLQSLKEMCQESLSKTLTLENAFKLLIFTDLHNANHLFEFTANFLVLNTKNIIDSQDFQQLLKSHPDLALRLLKKLSFPNNGH